MYLLVGNPQLHWNVREPWTVVGPVSYVLFYLYFLYFLIWIHIILFKE